MKRGRKPLARKTELAEYQSRHRQKKRAEGKIYRSFWLDPETLEYLQGRAEREEIPLSEILNHVSFD